MFDQIAIVSSLQRLLMIAMQSFTFNNSQHGADIFAGKAQDFAYSRLGNVRYHANLLCKHFPSDFVDVRMIDLT